MALITVRLQRDRFTEDDCEKVAQEFHLQGIEDIDVRRGPVSRLSVSDKVKVIDTMGEWVRFSFSDAKDTVENGLGCCM